MNIIRRIIEYCRGVFRRRPVPVNRFQRRSQHKRTRLKNKSLNKKVTISPEQEKRLIAFIKKLDPARVVDMSVLGPSEKKQFMLYHSSPDFVSQHLKEIRKKNSYNAVWRYLSCFIEEKKKNRRLREFINIWR